MCNCITMMDEQLKEHNTKLEIPIQITKSLNIQAVECVVISTIKINRRGHKGPISLFASFCPFCGVKYEVVDE